MVAPTSRGRCLRLAEALPSPGFLNRRVHAMHAVFQLRAWLPAGTLFRVVHPALHPEQRAAQVGERAGEAPLLFESPPDRIGDLGTLPVADEFRVAIAIEGKAVLDKNLAPVGERRIRRDPEAVSYTHLRAHETVLDLVC